MISEVETKTTVHIDAIKEQTTLNVKRHELKFFISKAEYLGLVHKLKYVLTQDSHCNEDKGYFIRSLYFDSHNEKCLNEKLSGIFGRKKYRLRFYSLDSEVLKFEIKNKLNNQIFKQSASISKVDARRVIDGDFAPLIESDNPILNKIYTEFVHYAYRPKVVIDYMRNAFVFDFFNVRITFDTCLRANNTDYSIFSNKLMGLPVLDEDKVIMEIKYNDKLPDYIRKILKIDSFQRSAISKYTLSRKLLRVNKWEDN